MWTNELCMSCTWYLSECISYYVSMNLFLLSPEHFMNSFRPCDDIVHKRLRVPFQYEYLSGTGISIIKIRWLWHHLIFIMGIHILIRWHPYIETFPQWPSHQRVAWLSDSINPWHEGTELSWFDWVRLTRSVSWLLMPWLLMSPDHQHPWYWLCWIVNPCLTLGRISTISVTSMSRNDIKCKYTFLFPLQNLACKGLNHYWTHVIRFPQWVCSDTHALAVCHTVVHVLYFTDCGLVMLHGNRYVGQYWFR